MKAPSILILLAMLSLAHTAFGQTVRWRFNLPTPQYQKDVTHATLVANDGSGGAVFLITDYRSYPPESGTSGLETAGSRLIWLSRSGALLHTMNIESLEGSSPYPILLTPSVLQIQIPENTGAAVKVQRVVRKARGVTVTEFTPPAGETFALGSTPINLVDQFGYFTFKKADESVTAIVRYSP